MARVVGSNVRRLRRDEDVHGIPGPRAVSLDRFVQAARMCGLATWTTGRAGDLESGRVGTSLETLYAVALALHHATGQPVTLADLLAGDGPVQINDTLTVQCPTLAGAVSGRPVTGSTEALDRLGEVMDTLTRTGITRLPEWKRLPKTVRRSLDPVGWLQVERALLETDERMCRSLGIDRDLGAALMTKLWGKPFTEERDRLAGPGANAQRKGQISRQLKAQLKEGTDGNN